MKSRVSGRDFLNLLLEIAPGYAPVRFNNHEPINKVFDSQNLGPALDIWDWNFLWRGAGSEIQGSVWAESRIHSSIYFQVSRKVYDLSLIINVITGISSRFLVDIAYIHLHTPNDVDDLNNYKYHLMPFVQSLTTHDLNKGLPDLCWGMYFGPPYRKLFGEKLDSVPAFRMLDDGIGVYIQLTKDIEDVTKNREQYLAAKSSAKQHLDSDAFYVENERRRCGVPNFQLGRILSKGQEA